MEDQKTSVHSNETSFTRGMNIKNYSEIVQKMISKSLGIKPLIQANPKGKFGMMFPGLEVFEPTNEAIEKISNLMKENSQDGEIISEIPLAFAFLGQFIDHDLTFDTTSELDERIDPFALENFRTPFLDLDCLYGTNPEVDRHLYDTNGGNTIPGSEHRSPFRLLTTDENISFDLPRNSQGTAIIGDPRNDENLFVSQLHRKFLGFHNEVIKYFLNENADNPLGNKKLYELARKEVTLHYHWIIKNEFLPLIIGKEMVNEIEKTNSRIFKFEGPNPFIPVEFAGAAYRFGHSLIPSKYQINDEIKEIDLFKVPFFGTVPNSTKDIGVPKKFNLDWKYFLDMGTGNHQFCSKVDTKLATPLFKLPFVSEQQNPPTSLPIRNIQRGRTLGLPSGQKIANELGLMPLTNIQLGLEGLEGLNEEAPLWYYILKESEIQSGVNGKHLGSVGGRIVGEVLLGIIEATQKLMFETEEEMKNWKPQFGSMIEEFTLKDLVNYKFIKPE